MLFARFLAECGLLIEPESGVPVSVDECKELALDRGVDWIALAASFAQSMLPQIFRANDAVLEVVLPAEHRQPLEELLASMMPETFVAEDSLGWAYQFWQSEEKERVNKAETKIGGDDIPAVTQLFTEDYMVEFLLHNTLGAWWAGRCFPGGVKADSESNARRAVVLPGIELKYLRFVDRGGGHWIPAAGTFNRWPSLARDIRLLDPCMGSAHFLVFALPILVAMRTVEDQVSTTEACFSVLRDNLVGLEIDLRCTQLGAFSLALAVWKLGGTQKLPQLSVACSGLKPNAKSDDWARLANRDDKARRGIEKLYEVFAQAPILGSLINPRRMSGSLMAASFDELQPLLEKALAREQADENLHELAVTAQGVARAAQLLASQFTLVATNVPYLGREGHNDALVAFSDRNHPDAAADLSTLMLDRCFEFVSEEGSVAVVMPQNWWVGKSYLAFRKRVLSTTTWQLAAVLGEEAWQTFGDRGPNTTLTIADTVPATTGHGFFAIDVSTKPGMPVVGVETKARALGGSSDTDELRKLSTLLAIDQGQLMSAREARITVARLGSAATLSQYVIAGEGCSTGDNARFLRGFWEVLPSQDWLCYCGPGFPGWEYCNTSLTPVLT